MKKLFLPMIELFDSILMMKRLILIKGMLSEN